MYQADHPNAGAPLTPEDLEAFQLCGNSLARHAFRLIDKIGIVDKTSGLTPVNQDAVWPRSPSTTLSKGRAR